VWNGCNASVPSRAHICPHRGGMLRTLVCVWKPLGGTYDPKSHAMSVLIVSSWSQMKVSPDAWPGVDLTIVIQVWKEVWAWEIRVKSHPGQSLAPLVLRCRLTSDNTNVWTGQKDWKDTEGLFFPPKKAKDAEMVLKGYIVLSLFLSFQTPGGSESWKQILEETRRGTVQHVLHSICRKRLPFNMIHDEVAVWCWNKQCRFSSAWGKMSVFLLNLSKNDCGARCRCRKRVTFGFTCKHVKVVWCHV